MKLTKENFMNRESIERVFRYEGRKYLVSVDIDEFQDYLTDEGDDFTIRVTCYDPLVVDVNNYIDPDDDQPDWENQTPFPDEVFQKLLENEGVLTSNMAFHFRDGIQSDEWDVSEVSYAAF